MIQAHKDMLIDAEHGVDLLKDIQEQRDRITQQCLTLVNSSQDQAAGTDVERKVRQFVETTNRHVQTVSTVSSDSKKSRYIGS